MNDGVRVKFDQQWENGEELLALVVANIIALFYIIMHIHHYT
jgi:hypothetical protein